MAERQGTGGGRALHFAKGRLDGKRRTSSAWDTHMTTATTAARPKALEIWRLAVRLPTLTASITPVIVGTGAAIHEDEFALLPALVAVFAAVCLQVAANLANDVFDFKRGADTEARLGPPRVTSSGWLSPGQVLLAMWGVLGLAFLAGVYLAAMGGWPIVVVGLVSIAAAIAYTGGPLPLAYHALGDVSTFVFFGLVAVTGTYYVQAREIAPVALAASVPIGCTVTAILVVNNLRDIETDRRVGKWTLAVLMGERATRAWYVLLVVLAYVVALGVVAAGARPWLAALLILPIPAVVAPVRGVITGAPGPALNPLLRATARFNLAFGVAFAAALALS